MNAGHREEGGPRLPVDVRTRFERFPASIKGAFVLRGADGNPHSVRLVETRIARIPTGPASPFTAEDRLLDVAPARDLFVPFEAGVSELESGWYSVECSVQVDGGGSLSFSSRPFPIPWPRSDVRRGTARIGLSVRVGGSSYRIERVDLGPDSATVTWEAETPASSAPDASEEQEPRSAEAVILADGEPLDLLPAEATSLRTRLQEFRFTGQQRSVSYPVPRVSRSVEVAIKLTSGEQSEAVPVPVP
jgi:hypothetical protein